MNSDVEQDTEQVRPQRSKLFSTNDPRIQSVMMKKGSSGNAPLGEICLHSSDFTQSSVIWPICENLPRGRRREEKHCY